MIRRSIASIYLPNDTFSGLNAISQNYLRFWPNNPFEVADFLWNLVVLLSVRTVVEIENARASRSIQVEIKFSESGSSVSARYGEEK